MDIPTFLIDFQEALRYVQTLNEDQIIEKFIKRIRVQQPEISDFDIESFNVDFRKLNEISGLLLDHFHQITLIDKSSEKEIARFNKTTVFIRHVLTENGEFDMVQLMVDQLNQLVGKLEKKFVSTRSNSFKYCYH